MANTEMFNVRYFSSIRLFQILHDVKLKFIPANENVENAGANYSFQLTAKIPFKTLKACFKRYSIPCYDNSIYFFVSSK